MTTTNCPEHQDYQAYLRSVATGIAPWRDGDAYDLEALSRLDARERRAARAFLAVRLAGADANSRDVEALGALADEESRALLQRALGHANRKIRRVAAECLGAQEALKG